ncbi:MAG: hypothetical protein ACYDIA_13760 [Candidatus Humimicrobiaceae bacterium]
MDNKRYNLKTLSEQINELILSGRQFVEIEDLLFLIGFDMKDINKFYVKHVKHRMRYEDRR